MFFKLKIVQNQSRGYVSNLLTPWGFFSILEKNLYNYYRDSHIGKHLDKCIPYKAALHETYKNREVQTSPTNERF